MGDKFDVICIGAALVDMVAKVERHPIEDDEVFVSDLVLLSGGAAANTAYVSAKLGLKVAFIGKLGHDDQFKNKIIYDFEEVNLDTSLIKYSKEYGTGSAYVVLNKNGDRRIYAYSGAANVLSINDIKSEEIVKGKSIFLSSLKNLEPFKKAAKIAKKNNIPVILNPGMLIIEQGFENIEELLSTVDILIISKREFLSLLFNSAEEFSYQLIIQRAQIIFNLGIKIIIITLGKEGALVLNSKFSDLVKPIEITKVIDTTGAGDAFSAGFLSSFIRNISYKFEDIKANVKIGNYVAGKCIQKLGARNGIPNSHDLILKSFD